jgi:sulfhydrogenase subunit delta
MGKPKVAFFDFTGCEGCQLSKLSAENYILPLLEHVDIVNFREAMTERSDDYDIAFIEGSISTPHCVERLNKIRSIASYIVAFGSCAHIGGINAMRNIMDTHEVRQEVYGDKQYWFPSIPAQPVSNFVKVDFYIPGCPPNPEETLYVIKSILLGKTPEIPDYAVCVECKLKENECVYSRGMTCMGPVTRAGCGAWCPSNGHYCYGCRGLITSDLNQEAEIKVLKEKGLSAQEIKNQFTLYNANNKEVK